MPTFLAALPWGKIIAFALAMLAGAYLAHRLDEGKIEHQKGLVVAEKLAHEKAVKDALVWSAQKQKEFDDVALKEARHDADVQRRLADTAAARLTEISRIPPTVLVRGCITYEFVRHLDAAITNRAASSLSIPAGKSPDACAPVDAVGVERWLLGIIATSQANGFQLDDLIRFFRSAQAAR